jgi:hypothetical protein
MEVKRIKNKGPESNPDPLAQAHLPKRSNVFYADFTPKNNEAKNQENIDLDGDIDLDAFWEYLCKNCQLDRKQENNLDPELQLKPRPASSLYELDPNLLRGLRSPKNVHGA